MIKQKSFLSILMVLSIFLLAGCSQSSVEPASEGMKTYCAAYLHRDDASIQKTKLSKDELEKNMVAGFVPTFQSSSDNLFTGDQAAKFAYAFIDLLKKIQIDTKLLDGDSHKAKVEVTVNQIDMKDLDVATIEKEVKNKISSFKTQEEAMEEFTNTSIKYLQKLEPKGKFSFTVDCTYDDNKKLWEPDDKAAFEKALFSATIKK